MNFHVTLKDLMDKMGVGFILGPYQTAPWTSYDAARGLTCSAEVRMGPDGDEIEAEIQLMYEIPPAGELPMQQICLIRAVPAGNNLWGIQSLKVKGEPFGKDIYNWEEKSCTFFAQVAQSLQRDEIPNIDELIEDILMQKERLADQMGGGGGKAPKIKTAQLLGMKKGGSF